MPRKPTDPSGAAVHTAIRLPPAIHAKLKEEAEAEGISISDAIRRRIESPADDRKTDELFVKLARVARALNQAYGPWQEHETATAIFAHVAGILIANAGKKSDPPAAFEAPKPGSVLDQWLKHPLVEGRDPLVAAATFFMLADRAEQLS